MRARLKGSALKGLAFAPGLAVALALAGVATAQAPADPAPAKAATGAPQGVSGVPGAVNTAPTTASATPPAAPSSPLLAMDGAPAMTVQPGIGQPVDGVMHLQPQVTRNGQFAHWMHDTVLFPLITAVCLLVLVLLAIVVVRFRRGANQTPSRTSHNTILEVAWTTIPVLILACIAVPSIGLLRAQYKPAPSGAVTLKAIGNQWYWSYQYPDNGGFEITANMLKERSQVSGGERARTDADGPRLLAADNRIVLPVGVPIRLITTSNDVIHSWAVPAFWIKLDAVPGRLNETSFTIEKPGLYFGQCSELCGARHAFMPIAVEAVPAAQFAAWVRAKGGTMPTPGKASDKVIPQPGAAVSAPKATDAAAAAGAAGPTTNGAVAAPVITQSATANPSGAGNGAH
jgi:cytochrome c oxidase subunit 2